MKDVIVKNASGLVVGGVINRLRTDKNVEFLNLQGNNLEVGFMNRDGESNVKAHYHNNIIRRIEGTHEILLFLSGEAKFFFYELNGIVIQSLKINSPCLVFFNGGCHEIKFYNQCEFIEIKQGPYLALEDKVIIDLGNDNDPRI